MHPSDPQRLLAHSPPPATHTTCVGCAIARNFRRPQRRAGRRRPCQPGPRRDETTQRGPFHQVYGPCALQRSVGAPRCSEPTQEAGRWCGEYKGNRSRYAKSKDGERTQSRHQGRCSTETQAPTAPYDYGYGYASYVYGKRLYDHVTTQQGYGKPQHEPHHTTTSYTTH